MLTLTEKIIFTLAAIVTIIAVVRVILRIIRIIGRGQGKPDWSLIPKRLFKALFDTISLAPVWRARFLPSFFHALVVWGFVFYMLVNLGDVLEGFIAGFHFLGSGMLGNAYRLVADILSVGVLLGMLALLIRRFLLKAPELSAREQTLLHPKARSGIQRDSLIVGFFILLHVGGRFFGEVFQLANEGGDVWQPLASSAAMLFSGWTPASLNNAEHVSFWFALGLIMAFFPYFLYSKHIHLFMTPINFMLTPERTSMGELEPLDFEDESIEQFGATNLEHLSWYQLLDAYACIMCNRCQDACPAYTTGKLLSPSALEINKRYYFNYEGASLEKGEPSSKTLLYQS